MWKIFNSLVIRKTKNWGTWVAQMVSVSLWILAQVMIIMSGSWDWAWPQALRWVGILLKIFSLYFCSFQPPLPTLSLCKIILKRTLKTKPHTRRRNIKIYFIFDWVVRCQTSQLSKLAIHTKAENVCNVCLSKTSNTSI